MKSKQTRKGNSKLVRSDNPRVSKQWLGVDRAGLRRQAKERGPANVFVELISNSLDERVSGVTQIHVRAEPVEGKPLVAVQVEDNSPRGYGDYLHHAYTLFADSYKRTNVEQSGQFNFGCKLWLSLCERARISTVSGTIEFHANEDRSDHPRQKRAVGTIVEGQMMMTRQEFHDLENLVQQLIVPEDVTVTFNGTPLTSRTPLTTFQATLPTKREDPNGVMRTLHRETTVMLYEPVEGRKPMLYEFAVPVVETDIRWDVQVCQKVPLSISRDNVTPAYIRDIKRVVAEHMNEVITRDDAAGWCNDVLADAKSSRQACEAIIRNRFGENAATFDPSDQEANVRWQTEHGGTLVTGSSLSKEQWANVRRFTLLKPTGLLTPSPKPYSDDPDAPPATFYTESEMTDGMVAVRERACTIADAIGVVNLTVRFAKDMNQSVLACYRSLGKSAGEIQFNVRRLGEEWFAHENAIAIDEIVIHELAHHFVSSHTHPEPSAVLPGGRFYDACCHVAAKALNKAPQPLSGI